MGGPYFCVPLFCKDSPYFVRFSVSEIIQGKQPMNKYTKRRGLLFCKGPFISVLKLQNKGPHFIRYFSFNSVIAIFVEMNF